MAKDKWFGIEKYAFVFIIAIALDLVMTIIGTSLGYKEGHPLMSWVLNNFGYIGLILSFGFLIYFVLKYQETEFKDRHPFVYKTLIAIGTGLRLFVIVSWVFLIW